MKRGVDTATSTPQVSSKSHSLLGLLTRATVRGTPYSVLASREMTRLALSSPVAATMTSQVSAPARSSASMSQASASCQSASGTEAIRMASAERSTSVTSWPWLMSSRAMERPTDPAPAITICMAQASCDGACDRARRT